MALPIQRRMFSVLADDRVDNDSVAGEALLDDPWWQRCRDHSKFLARPASPFLSFRNQHEILRRLYIELGTLLVANHNSFLAATFAHALLRRTRQDPLHARKIRRHSWRPGCLPDFLVERCTRSALFSASMITSLTTGSISNNSSCASGSFSPAAPYFSIRISRRRSSSTRILSSAYRSRLFSSPMSSRSAGAEGMGA